jgi:SSS family solute:Na+ symporter
MHLGTLDLSVVAIYAIILLVIAQWVSREKTGHQKNSSDYFLAGRALPWWAIGASLIAANISAEQIIGMSGSAWVMGIAIGAYEWMAALTLVIVAKWLLPVFLKHKIYTMPQFLEQRYDHRVRTVMALFWLGIYVFVNLTSILWLGALAVNTVTGVDLTVGLIALGAFAAAYSLYGGLKAVALTDIIQVTLLVLTPERFDLIFTKDSPHYVSLPGISVLVGGMWIMNLSYWGFNQYIIQRALAAKSTREAQKGIMMFAAFLKMIMPLIIVLPGVAAAILAPDLEAPDRAYPTVMNLLPSGILGLVFAALIAAIVSSLASMPGVHGFLYAGCLCIVPARLLLAEDDLGCGTADGAGFGRVLDYIQAGMARATVYRSRRHSVPVVYRRGRNRVAAPGRRRPSGCD